MALTRPLHYRVSLHLIYLTNSFAHFFIFFFVSAELRAEYSSQLEREHEMREHVEKQYQEEQKIRSKFGLVCVCVSVCLLCSIV